MLEEVLPHVNHVDSSKIFHPLATPGISKNFMSSEKASQIDGGCLVKVCFNAGKASEGREALVFISGVKIVADSTRSKRLEAR